MKEVSGEPRGGDIRRLKIDSVEGADKGVMNICHVRSNVNDWVGKL